MSGNPSFFLPGIPGSFCLFSFSSRLELTLPFFSLSLFLLVSSRSRENSTAKVVPRGGREKESFVPRKERSFFDDLSLPLGIRSSAASSSRWVSSSPLVALVVRPVARFAA